MARRESELLSFGQFSVLSWSTVELSSIKSTTGMMKRHPDDLQSIANRCVPGLHAIMFHVISMRDGAGQELMVPLLALAAALRDIGIEIDPDQLFGKLYFALHQAKAEDGKYRPVVRRTVGRVGFNINMPVLSTRTLHNSTPRIMQRSSSPVNLPVKLRH
jgi:hypothetical protein